MKTLRWIVVLASAAWMGLTIWQEFFAVDPTPFGFRSPEVEAEMRACGGSFHQRYECKEAIILAKGHDSFLIWVEKVCLILGPPLLVAYAVARLGRPASPYDEDAVRRSSLVAKRRVR